MPEAMEPLRDMNKLLDIVDDLMHDQTKHGKRMYLLFATLFYTGLRVSDVIRLRKENVYDSERGQSKNYITLMEQKTGKRIKKKINDDLRDIYDVRLEDLRDEDFLFQSRTGNKDGSPRHITIRTAERDMEIIKTRYNITTPFCCHSLRKTYGYVQYKRHEVTLESLRKQFNHSSEDVTRRYIGIEQEEIDKDVQKVGIPGFIPERPKKKRKRGKDTDESPLYVEHKAGGAHKGSRGVYGREAKRSDKR